MKSGNGILGYLSSGFIAKRWSAKYFSGILWSFSEKALKFLAELLVGFYIARALGVTDFGALNFAISFTVLFQGLSTLGLSDLLTREIVNNGGEAEKITKTALTMRLVSSVVLVLIINLLAWDEETVIRKAILAVSISLIFRSFESLISYFQAVVKYNLVAKVQIAATVVVSIFKILLVTSNANLEHFAWAYAAEWFLISMGLSYQYLKSHSLFPLRINMTYAKRLFLDAWPLMLSSIAINIYMRLDQIMLRQIHGDTENGYYAAALRLTEIWYVIPTVFGSILFPAILNARNTSRNLYRSRLLQLNSFMFWCSFSIALATTPFATDIISLLYGSDFKQAGGILAIQIWSGIFTFMGVSGTFWLMAENLQYVSLIRTLVGLGVNVILNLVLIPKLSGIGAAVSMLVTQAFATTFSLMILKKTRPLIKMQWESIFYPIRKMLRYVQRRSKNQRMKNEG